MHTANRSYIIHYTPRTGSTFLAESLQNTGIAGQPEELFNILPGESNLSGKYGIRTFRELQECLWEIGTSSNGVFASKGNPSPDQLVEIAQLPGADPATCWSELFPNAKHLYLTRRHKARQAVSWWVAIKSDCWHLRSTERPALNDAFMESAYDFDALSHLFQEASIRECGIQAFFQQRGIVPLTVAYEDLIRSFEPTMHKVLDYLELDAPGVPIVAPALRPTASAQTEQWVQRFRKDLQRGLDQPFW